MRKILVFKVKRNFFVERIENPVNIENIIEFNILKDFLSNKIDEEVKTLYVNEIYLGLKSVEIAVNSSIFENGSLISIEIYEKNLIQLIEAFEAESIMDENTKSNDEILWEDILFDNLDDEYDIFL